MSVAAGVGDCIPKTMHVGECGCMLLVLVNVTACQTPQIYWCQWVWKPANHSILHSRW